MENKEGTGINCRRFCGAIEYEITLPIDDLENYNIEIYSLFGNTDPSGKSYSLSVVGFNSDGNKSKGKGNTCGNSHEKKLTYKKKIGGVEFTITFTTGNSENDNKNTKADDSSFNNEKGIRNTDVPVMVIKPPREENEKNSSSESNDDSFEKNLYDPENFLKNICTPIQIVIRKKGENKSIPRIFSVSLPNPFALLTGIAPYSAEKLNKLFRITSELGIKNSSESLIPHIDTFSLNGCASFLRPMKGRNDGEIYIFFNIDCLYERRIPLAYLHADQPKLFYPIWKEVKLLDCFTEKILTEILNGNTVIFNFGPTIPFNLVFSVQFQQILYTVGQPPEYNIDNRSNSGSDSKGCSNDMPNLGLKIEEVKLADDNKRKIIRIARYFEKSSKKGDNTSEPNGNSCFEDFYLRYLIYLKNSLENRKNTREKTLFNSGINHTLKQQLEGYINKYMQVMGYPSQKDSAGKFNFDSEQIIYVVPPPVIRFKCVLNLSSRMNEGGGENTIPLFFFKRYNGELYTYFIPVITEHKGNKSGKSPNIDGNDTEKPDRRYILRFATGKEIFPLGIESLLDI